ncbi:hypothetical protein KUL17_41070 [Alteromonas sp. KUL17]|nr:hypothetical protein KUL17_41070 [Alteromonas sp. KUL17]
MSMGKDNFLIYQSHGVENLATLRKLELNMLKAVSAELSIPRKQKKCIHEN